jgi:hypothetical protein
MEKFLERPLFSKVRETPSFLPFVKRVMGLYGIDIWKLFVI